MASINIGDREYTALIGRSIAATRDLTSILRANRDSTENIVNSLRSNLNVVGKLSDAVQNVERVQLKAISLGTSYNKLIEANTKTIQSSILTQQQTGEIILESMGEGLRNSGASLDRLNQEMKFLGQNYKQSILAFANLNSTTINSSDIQERLVKIIKDTQKDYGVSTEKLTRGLVNLQDSLQSFSIYGDSAVESLASIKIALMGRVGGNEAGSKNIDIITKMSEALNIGQQTRFGLIEEMTQLREGTIGPDKLLESFRRVVDDFKSATEGSDILKEVLANTYGKSQLTAMISLVNAADKQNKLTEAQKASQDEINNSIAARQRDIDAWYGEYAPQIHTWITKYYPAILGGIAAQRIISRTFSSGPRVNPGTAVGPAGEPAGGMIRGNGGGMADLVGGGLSLAAMTHPVGRVLTGILAVAGLGVAASRYYSESEKQQDKIVKNLEEINAKSDNPTTVDRGIANAARFASSFLSDTIKSTTQESMLRQLERMNRNLEMFYNNKSNTDPTRL